MLAIKDLLAILAALATMVAIDFALMDMLFG